MSIVYDFPAIAAKLRKDDFFTPSRKEVEPVAEEPSPIPPAPSWRQGPPVILSCPNCGSQHISKGFGSYLCVNCNATF